MADLHLCNARFRGRGDALSDIVIASGRIVGLGPDLCVEARRKIDLAGRLVTESYVNPHLHLCKVWTLPMVAEAALEAYRGEGMRDALSAIALASKVKETYDASWIIENGRRAVALAALYGNLHIRAFADVDAKAQLEGIKALVALRDEFRGLVDIQVVGFPQDGIIGEAGVKEMMRRAMELGADVVGGIPWVESTDAEAQEHIRICFDLAREFDKDVSMLLDDAGDPGLRTLEFMAVETLRRGWEGRALAHHCRAMALYPKPYLGRLARLLRRAQITIVSHPHTGPLHAPVKDLVAAGIPVCLGQDDISDAYYPLGRNNMLEIAFLASHLLWMTSEAEVENLYDMVTVTAARAMRIADFGLTLGAPADLVVLDQPNLAEALRFHEAPVLVISQGKPVDPTRMRRLAGIAYSPPIESSTLAEALQRRSSDLNGNLG